MTKIFLGSGNIEMKVARAAAIAIQIQVSILSLGNTQALNTHVYVRLSRSSRRASRMTGQTEVMTWLS